MPKFSNVVRCQVKPDAHEAFMAAFEDGPSYPGLQSQFVIKTGEHTYCSCGIWESQEALVAARPQMIGFLDTIRGLLVELSPELGVTDPVSGTVIYEEGLS
tara:strand:+ start:235 stop:537 length:303 start_codon:yes stop_codon:yes gene_type:complete